jgi:hypothetical protein
LVRPRYTTISTGTAATAVSVAINTMTRNVAGTSLTAYHRRTALLAAATAARLTKNRCCSACGGGGGCCPSAAGTRLPVRPAQPTRQHTSGAPSSLPVLSSRWSSSCQAWAVHSCWNAVATITDKTCSSFITFRRTGRGRRTPKCLKIVSRMKMM